MSRTKSDNCPRCGYKLGRFHPSKLCRILELEQRLAAAQAEIKKQKEGKYPK